VVTAKNPAEWARTFSRLALGQAERSPFVEITHGTKVKVRFDRKIPYELDGGARPACRELRIKAQPGSITICVPAQAAAVSAAAAGGGHA
jgi:diacylglycerol kinase family enzyme